MKVFRNITPVFKRIEIVENGPLPKINLIAMAVDTFVAWRSDTLPVNPPEPFCSAGVDEKWIGLPLSNSEIDQFGLMEYIAVHLSSDLTFCTINYRYDVSSPEMKGEVTTVPAASLAYVPGPINILLILTDKYRLKLPETVQIGDLAVPVFLGIESENGVPVPPIVPVDFGSAWRSYYVTKNIPRILGNLNILWNHLVGKIAVADTVQKVITLASELSGVLAPGMYVFPSEDKIAYNKERPIIGGSNIMPSDEPKFVPLSNGSSYKIVADTFKSDATRKSMSYRIQGVNLGSLSPLHAPPCGVFAVHTNRDFGVVAPASPSSDLESSYFTYAVPVASTTKRLAIHLGLISTNDASYRFYNPHALAGWLQMLAVANAANVACFLLLCDIPCRDWSGYSHTEEINDKIEDIKCQINDELLCHSTPDNFMDQWSLYNPKWFEIAFPGIDPFNSRAWYQHSPVASHLTQQWIEKLSLATPPIPTESDIAFDSCGDDISESLIVYENKKTAYTYFLESQDTEKYHPILFDNSRYLKNENRVLGSWIDMTHFQTLIASGCGRRIVNPRYTQTLTCTESVDYVTKYEHGHAKRSLHIYETHALSLAWKSYLPKVTPITWPAPCDVAKSSG